MIQVFPVAVDPPASTVHYWDDFGQPRGTPQNPRTHQGNDLFAPKGRAVLAPDDGVLHFYTDPIGGPSFTLKSPDGWGYYGTHLSGYEGGDRTVQAGEVVAYVGDLGNAHGTPPHLHFQISIRGVTVDPFPYLERAPRRPTPGRIALSSGQAAAVAAGIVTVGALVALAIRRRRVQTHALRIHA